MLEIVPYKQNDDYHWLLTVSKCSKRSTNARKLCIDSIPIYAEMGKELLCDFQNTGYRNITIYTNPVVRVPVNVSDTHYIIIRIPI